MNAPLTRSLLLPITASDALAEIREILAAADRREQQEREAARQRAALARKMALADLIGARP